MSGYIIVGFKAWQGYDQLYVGDSGVLNTPNKAYLSFDIDDLGDIDGIIIKNVFVIIPIDEISGHPSLLPGSTIKTAICYYGNSLELSDLNLGAKQAGSISATDSLTDFNISSYKVESELQIAADTDKKWFQLRIEPSGALANNIADHYKLYASNANLQVTYEIP